MSWTDAGHPALLGEKLEQDRVRCGLSPRRCLIAPGQSGFCRVRANRDGRLVTLNYGKGVHLTQEVIETEAVYHYAPGSPILSLGNIGCNLDCRYCQNWKTSQARLVDDADVRTFTPQQVVETALRHGIPILSWTYNDPVVWHEFVLDAARLAREAGLLNLYKSALYITPEALDQLLDVIDIFSISLKSLVPDYYPRLTSGELAPVLAAIKQVHRAGKHLELSNLMVTDISDQEESARRLVAWVLEALDDSVPLHFVRFHPEYRLASGVRTPVDRLRRAREVALEMGLKHVYIGNYPDREAASSRCLNCGALLVTRFNLHARILELDAQGRCLRCGTPSGVRGASGESIRQADRTAPLPPIPLEYAHFNWRGEITSLHVWARNRSNQTARLFHRRLPAQGGGEWREINLLPGEEFRFLLHQADPDQTGIEAAFPPHVETDLFEVFDRAHFPTIPVKELSSGSDESPLPRYPGKHLDDRTINRLRAAVAPGGTPDPTATPSREEEP